MIHKYTFILNWTLLKFPYLVLLIGFVCAIFPKNNVYDIIQLWAHRGTDDDDDANKLPANKEQ